MTVGEYRRQIETWIDDVMLFAPGHDCPTCLDAIIENDHTSAGLKQTAQIVKNQHGYWVEEKYGLIRALRADLRNMMDSICFDPDALDDQGRRYKGQVARDDEWAEEIERGEEIMKEQMRNPKRMTPIRGIA